MYDWEYAIPHFLLAKFWFLRIIVELSTFMELNGGLLKARLRPYLRNLCSSEFEGIDNV